MVKDNIKTCKTCAHFKNQQMLLNYWESTGFCVNPKFEFNNRIGRLIGVIDTQNLQDRTRVSGNPSHDFEVLAQSCVKGSRYLLQVEEEFGCIYHESKKK